MAVVALNISDTMLKALEGIVMLKNILKQMPALLPGFSVSVTSLENLTVPLHIKIHFY